MSQVVTFIQQQDVQHEELVKHLKEKITFEQERGTGLQQEINRCTEIMKQFFGDLQLPS